MAARNHTCLDCGAPCSAINLCESCVDTRVVAERAAQGLPPTVTDPAVLDQIAALVAPRPTEQRGAA